jgi:hypothetical protein
MLCLSGMGLRCLALIHHLTGDGEVIGFYLPTLDREIGHDANLKTNVIIGWHWPVYVLNFFHGYLSFLGRPRGRGAATGATGGGATVDNAGSQLHVQADRSITAAIDWRIVTSVALAAIRLPRPTALLNCRSIGRSSS